MKKNFAFLLIAAIVAALVGCNTMRGVGQDIEAAGKGIQRSTR